MIAPQTFERTRRLLAASDFARVFEQRQVRRGRFFSAHWQLRTGGSTGRDINDRLGLVVAKKLVKNAVHRNLLKRLCREAFRRRPRVSDSAPIDLVLRLSVKLDGKTAMRSRAALAKDIDALLNAVALKARRA